VALEQVSLFGLIIVADRKVSYGPVNPQEACDIFIRGALIEGDVKKPFKFMQHNQQIIDDILALEDRVRRRDVLIGEEEMVAFYRERLKGIYNLKALSKLLKKKGTDTFLHMREEELVARRPQASELSLYPRQIDLGNQVLDCSYRFEPGDDEDGLTVIVPATLADRIPAEAMDWLVPGYQAGQKCLKHFIEFKLSDYNDNRNDPTCDGQSNLSPYLHFGQLSAQRVALEVESADIAPDLKNLYVPGTSIRVVASAGVKDQTNGKNTRILTRASNIILGTDLTGDFEQFKMWYSEDNDQVRATMKWAIGVTLVQPELAVVANKTATQLTNF